MLPPERNLISWSRNGLPPVGFGGVSHASFFRYGTMPSNLQLSMLHPQTCDACGLCCEGIGSPVLLYASRPDSAGAHPFRPPGLPEGLIREIDEQFLGLVR